MLVWRVGKQSKYEIYNVIETLPLFLEYMMYNAVYDSLFYRYLAQVNNDSAGATVKDKPSAKLKV